MQRELFIPCFSHNPSRAAMMLTWPSGDMSVTPLVVEEEKTAAPSKDRTFSQETEVHVLN